MLTNWYGCRIAQRKDSAPPRSLREPLPFKTLPSLRNRADLPTPLRETRKAPMFVIWFLRRFTVTTHSIFPENFGNFLSPISEQSTKRSDRISLHTLPPEKVVKKSAKEQYSKKLMSTIFGKRASRNWSVYFRHFLFIPQLRVDLITDNKETSNGTLNPFSTYLFSCTVRLLRHVKMSSYKSKNFLIVYISITIEHINYSVHTMSSCPMA